MPLKPVAIKGTINCTQLLVMQIFFSVSFVGNCEIDLEIKRYFCRAGVKSIQVSFKIVYHLLKFSKLCSKRKVEFLLARKFFEVYVCRLQLKKKS